MKELVLDLSHWDGQMDLAAWKQHRGLWGVIIKAGGNERKLGRYEDPMFESHYQTAKSAGLHIGFYYYTVTTDVNNAIEDGNHFCDLIEGKDADLPCYMDVEDPAQFELSKRTLTDVIINFCDTVNNRGRYAGLYTGGSAWLNKMYYQELLKYADWIAWWRGSWPTEAGNIGMWQQGGIRYSDGDIVYGDQNGYHDCDWCAIDYPSIIGKEEKKEEPVMSNVRDRIVEKAYGELGVRYYSMHEGPRGSGDEGWGCAMFYAWCLNQILGTNYYGSCWNFSGDALGQGVNQGGNQFRFISENEAKPGDAVIYIAGGYDGNDYDDYGHIAMYVGDGRVIGAMGRKTPGDWNYLNIGISETPISTQEIGGGHRFLRPLKIEEAEKKVAPVNPPKPKVYGYSTRLYGSNNTPAQQFKFEYAGDGYLYIRSVLRNMMLDVKDGLNVSKTPVRVWEFNGGANAQQWKLIPCNGEYQGQYELAPKCAPDLRLDAVNGGTTKKTGLQIYKSNNTPAQRWYIIDSGDNIYRFANAKSGLCIDCGDGVQ